MKLKQSQLREESQHLYFFSILEARHMGHAFSLGRAAGTGSSGNMAFEA